MSEKDLFPLKIIADDESLCDDPFFAWLDTHAKKDDGAKGMDHILAYLGDQGFVVGQHRLSDRDVKVLEYVLDSWYRMTPWGEMRTLDALFDDSNPKFYVKGLSERRGITSYLLRLIEQAGWIYEVKPETTYFEVIDNRLYAKYQSILGDRFLCRIEGEVK